MNWCINSCVRLFFEYSFVETCQSNGSVPLPHISHWHRKRPFRWRIWAAFCCVSHFSCRILSFPFLRVPGARTDGSNQRSLKRTRLASIGWFGLLPRCDSVKKGYQDRPNARCLPPPPPFSFFMASCRSVSLSRLRRMLLDGLEPLHFKNICLSLLFMFVRWCVCVAAVAIALPFAGGMFAFAANNDHWKSGRHFRICRSFFARADQKAHAHTMRSAHSFASAENICLW